MSRLLGFSTAAFFLAFLSSAAAAPDKWAGTYRCMGVSPDGKKYNCRVIITHKKGDEYHVRWTTDEAEEGDGTVIRKTLVVKYKGKAAGTRGTITYKAEDDDTLLGTFKSAGGTKEGTEKLTRLK
jgi:hypothetical protein